MRVDLSLLLTDEKFLARFWAKVDKSAGPDGCWLWTGCRMPTGYGQLRVFGKVSICSHRISWEITNGPLPQGTGFHGTCVCHRCDNPSCCNPAHLFIGSHKDNMNDRDRKGRVASGARSGHVTHPESFARGEQHACSKLTERAVREILSQPHLATATLGSMYGVTDGAIRHIRRGTSWKHLDRSA